MWKNITGEESTKLIKYEDHVLFYKNKHEIFCEVYGWDDLEEEL
tara:strand:+ start:132 stop:263 length:132 start_codon:yes stop_codon:yes gene_type:complete